MSDAALTIAIAGVLMLPSVLGAIYQLRHPPTGRTTSRRMFAGLATQAVQLGTMGLLYADGRFTFADVGLHTDDLSGALFIGVLAAFVFLLAMSPLMNTHSRRSYGQAARRGARMLPREPAGRAAFCTYVLVNNVSEELLSRGVFVHLVALTTGSLWVGLVSGLALNALVHAYQGLAVVPFHVLHFALAVLLLYSPWGLAAAMACHFALNLPVLRTRRLLYHVRARRLRLTGGQ